MTRSSRVGVLAVVVALMMGVVARGEQSVARPADLVLRGGRVVTMNPAQPTAEAIAVRGDVIVAVGGNAELASFVGPKTRVIELGGKLVVPGLVDSHLHFSSLGASLLQLDLMDERSWPEIVSKVAAAVAKAKPGELISGRGWHQEKWQSKPVPNVEGFPVHDALSAVSPNNPVVLTHASGHAAIANAKAMALAGIAAATKNPPGGEILHDSKGNPTGVLRETAEELLEPMHASLPKLSPAEAEARARRQIELAGQACLEQGVTSVHDAGISFAQVDRYKRMVDDHALPVRVYAMLGESNAALAREMVARRLIDYGDRRLTVRAIKRLADGALGPRGAWLLEPYSDLPGHSGLNTYPMKDLAETARLALANGYQLCVHCIGDRANRETLDVYQAAFAANPERRDVRWRIEHAQHLTGADIPRFGKLGVIAAMQGIHCTSDGSYVLARLGPERASSGTYAWRSLLASGAVVANGTDAPVERVDTMPGFFALVTRKLKDGSEFFPAQKLTREEALRAYTLAGAFAAFEEKSKGSLEVGKLADILVLSKDIMTIPAEEIPTAKVVTTILGGKVVFSR